MSETDVKLPIVILGVSPEGRAAADILQLTDRFIYGYLSLDPDETRTEIDDVPVLGGLDNAELRAVLKSHKTEYVLASSQAAVREPLMRELIELSQRIPLTVIHPAAWVSGTADLAGGNLIFAGALIGAGVRMEAVNFIGMGATIEPEVVMGAANTLGAGVVVGTGAQLGSRIYIGAGAVIHAGVRIGDGAVVAAGAVVLRNVEADSQVVGNPAQALSK